MSVRQIVSYLSAYSTLDIEDAPTIDLFAQTWDWRRKDTRAQPRDLDEPTLRSTFTLSEYLRLMIATGGIAFQLDARLYTAREWVVRNELTPLDLIYLCVYASKNFYLVSTGQHPHWLDKVGVEPENGLRSDACWTWVQLCIWRYCRIAAGTDTVRTQQEWELACILLIAPSSLCVSVCMERLDNLARYAVQLQTAMIRTDVRHSNDRESVMAMERSDPPPHFLDWVALPSMDPDVRIDYLWDRFRQFVHDTHAFTLTAPLWLPTHDYLSRFYHFLQGTEASFLDLGVSSSEVRSVPVIDGVFECLVGPWRTSANQHTRMSVWGKLFDSSSWYQGYTRLLPTSSSRTSPSLYIDLESLFNISMASASPPPSLVPGLVRTLWLYRRVARYLFPALRLPSYASQSIYMRRTLQAVIVAFGLADGLCTSAFPPLPSAYTVERPLGQAAVSALGAWLWLILDLSTECIHAVSADTDPATMSAGLCHRLSHVFHDGTGVQAALHDIMTQTSRPESVTSMDIETALAYLAPLRPATVSATSGGCGPYDPLLELIRIHVWKFQPIHETAAVVPTWSSLVKWYMTVRSSTNDLMERYVQVLAFVDERDGTPVGVDLLKPYIASVTHLTPAHCSAHESNVSTTEYGQESSTQLNSKRMSRSEGTVFNLWSTSWLQYDATWNWYIPAEGSRPPWLDWTRRTPIKVIVDRFLKPKSIHYEGSRSLALPLSALREAYKAIGKEAMAQDIILVAGDLTWHHWLARCCDRVDRMDVSKDCSGYIHGDSSPALYDLFRLCKRILAYLPKASALPVVPPRQPGSAVLHFDEHKRMYFAEPGRGMSWSHVLLLDYLTSKKDSMDPFELKGLLSRNVNRFLPPSANGGTIVAHNAQAFHILRSSSTLLSRQEWAFLHFSSLVVEASGCHHNDSPHELPSTTDAHRSLVSEEFYRTHTSLLSLSFVDSVVSGVLQSSYIFRTYLFLPDGPIAQRFPNVPFFTPSHVDASARFVNLLRYIKYPVYQYAYSPDPAPKDNYLYTGTHPSFTVGCYLAALIKHLAWKHEPVFYEPVPEQWGPLFEYMYPHRSVADSLNRGWTLITLFYAWGIIGGVPTAVAPVQDRPAVATVLVAAYTMADELDRSKKWKTTVESLKAQILPPIHQVQDTRDVLLNGREGRDLPAQMNGLSLDQDTPTLAPVHVGSGALVSSLMKMGKGLVKEALKEEGEKIVKGFVAQAASRLTGETVGKETTAPVTDKD